MTPGEGHPGAAAPRTRMRRVLVWFRRDLRVADNPALVAALQMAEEVIPVFIWAPEEEGQFQPGRCLRWWLHSSLRAFEADLAALGSRMVYAKASESRIALAQLVRDLGAQGVLFNHLYDPISMVKDNEVKASLAAMGVHCQSFGADVLREPWEVLDPQGRPFTCFEDYWTAHCSLPYPPSPPLPVPAVLPPVPADVKGLSLGDLGMMLPEEEMSNVQLEYHWTPGGAGAHQVLMGFLGQRLRSFGRDRAKTDRNSTSRLSPHIHCGEVSVRHVYYLAKAAEAEWGRQGEGGSSVADFLRQVGYREYSRYLSFHFPFTHERSLLEHLRAVPWKFDQRLFKAWRQGRTGYPLVDAGMRELWSTGWFHNRIRVVAASFLVKNLLLPWQWGLKHYWDAQLDADLESDALGWQYCAGCMADAHEFSYIMDLRVESKRFDPDGNYVRRWLPVLARLPAKYIHAPWEAPEQVLDDAGVELGVNYPLPIISPEQSAADLAKANAFVLSCQRGEGAGEVGVPDYDACVLPPRGPFRPATELAAPGLAEQLWGQSVAPPMTVGLGVGAGGRRRPLEAGGEEWEGQLAQQAQRAQQPSASEEVQSNVVVMDDASEVANLPPHRPVRAQQAQQAQQGAAAAAMATGGSRGATVGVAPAPGASVGWPGDWKGVEPWPVAAQGPSAAGHWTSGEGTRPTATDFPIPSASPQLHTGPRSNPSTAGQYTAEATEHEASVAVQGATSPQGIDAAAPGSAEGAWQGQQSASFSGGACGGSCMRPKPKGGQATEGPLLAPQCKRLRASEAGKGAAAAGGSRSGEVHAVPSPAAAAAGGQGSP